MTLNRNHYKGEFKVSPYLAEEHPFPAWNCPACFHGTIVPNMETEITRASSDCAFLLDVDGYMGNPLYGPFYLEFNCHTCKEVVFLVGSYMRYQQNDPMTRPEVQLTTYTPRFFVPHIPLFEIDDRYPESVGGAVSEAFSTFWSDLGATANGCRKVVERLMTEQKVNKTNGATGTKRKFLSLHERITKFATTKSKYAPLGELLLATKWIGNTGSHSGNLTRDDVLDAFEILELVLKQIYVQPMTVKKAGKINKKKKPLGGK